MKKYTILMIFMLTFFFSRCTHSTQDSTITSEPDTVVGEEKMLFVNMPYTARMSMSVVLNPKGIANQYGEPTEVIKVDNRTYEARNISDGSKLIVVYKDNRMIDMWQLKSLLNRSQFDVIKMHESTLEDVLSIDPYTTLIENDKQGTSSHRLDDGIAVISYSKKDSSDTNSADWIVQKIEFDDNDYSGFSEDDTVKKLLQED